MSRGVLDVLEREANLARWIGKALGVVFFYLFVLVGASLLVYAVITALSSVGHIGERPEEYLLKAIGLATIGAATCDLGGVFLGVLSRAFTPSEALLEEETHADIVAFLRVVVIAISVEGLVLMFKGAAGGDSEDLPLGAVIVASAALLLISVGVFHRLTRNG